MPSSFPPATSTLVEVRSARAADLGDIMRVMQAAFDPVYGEAWTHAQMLSLFAFPASHVAVATLSGAIVGFSAARIAGPESELLLIAVDPLVRGRGVGGVLLDSWQLWSGDQGATEFFLEMRADNPAIHLYSRAGFVESGRRLGYYDGRDGVKRDAITMKRILYSA
jgi:[ribosomal protein S18]-alanine N-acetyltransferase